MDYDVVEYFRRRQEQQAVEIQVAQLPQRVFWLRIVILP